MIIRMYLTNGLKGQQAHSPGQRPGYGERVIVALKGQKPWTEAMPPTHSFALTGRGCALMPTQGAALGYGLSGLSGRICRALGTNCPTQGAALGYGLSGLSGRICRALGTNCPTQGVALGYVLIALSGRSLQNLRNLKRMIIKCRGRPRACPYKQPSLFSESLSEKFAAIGKAIVKHEGSP